MMRRMRSIQRDRDDAGETQESRRAVVDRIIRLPPVPRSTARVSPIPLIHAALQRVLPPATLNRTAIRSTSGASLFAAGPLHARSPSFFPSVLRFCFFFFVCSFSLFSKRNEDEEASEKLYCHVTHVNVPTFKGLSTVAVKDE